MILWSSELVSDLARCRTVLFLGSGISRNSTSAIGRQPKTWVEFLKSIAQDVNPNRHINALIREKDYLTACEVLKNTLGREAFHQRLRDEYLIPGYRHALIHAHIFRLDSRIVATPNFDKIYETYANHSAGSSIIVKHHYDPDTAEAIRGTERVILKIHGTIDSPNRMIFTRKEYAKAREEFRGFFSLLEALALTHTFLFLGCGVNDPDTRLLLEDTFFRHPSSKPHVFVLPIEGLHNSIRAVLQDSMNLVILTYKAMHDHKELTDSLEQLVVLVESERDNLRRNGNW
ncbi:MAG: SIR2 family protein [Syntrophobacteraceae bacterium]